MNGLIDRLPVASPRQVKSDSQHAGGQKQIDGLPVTTQRLQDGHPVCLLAAYVCLPAWGRVAAGMLIANMSERARVCTRSGGRRAASKSSRGGERLRQTQSGVQGLPGGGAKLQCGE